MQQIILTQSKSKNDFITQELQRSVERLILGEETLWHIHYYCGSSLWKKSCVILFKQHSHLWHRIITDADFIHVADFPDREERLSRVLGKCFCMAACLKKKFIGHYFLLIIYLLEPAHMERHFLLWDLWQKRHFAERPKWKGTLKNK